MKNDWYRSTQLDQLYKIERKISFQLHVDLPPLATKTDISRKVQVQMKNDWYRWIRLDEAYLMGQ